MSISPRVKYGKRKRVPKEGIKFTNPKFKIWDFDSWEQQEDNKYDLDDLDDLLNEDEDEEDLRDVVDYDKTEGPWASQVGVKYHKNARAFRQFLARHFDRIKRGLSGLFDAFTRHKVGITPRVRKDGTVVNKPRLKKKYKEYKPKDLAKKYGIKYDTPNYVIYNSRKDFENDPRSFHKVNAGYRVIIANEQSREWRSWVGHNSKFISDTDARKVAKEAARQWDKTKILTRRYKRAKTPLEREDLKAEFLFKHNVDLYRFNNLSKAVKESLKADRINNKEFNEFIRSNRSSKSTTRRTKRTRTTTKKRRTPEAKTRKGNKKPKAKKT